MKTNDVVFLHRREAKASLEILERVEALFDALRQAGFRMPGPDEWMTSPGDVRPVIRYLREALG